MATSKERDKEHGKGHLAMNTPPIVSREEWEAARQQLLVKEKALTRSRDALAPNAGGCRGWLWTRSTSSTGLRAR
jgi:hypothetical protein